MLELKHLLIVPLLLSGMVFFGLFPIVPVSELAALNSVLIADNFCLSSYPLGDSTLAGCVVGLVGT